MSEQEQDLTPAMQKMMAQMARMQAELDSLKSQPQVSTQPTGLPKKEISTSRRKVLRRLAGGLVAGLALGGASLAFPPKTEAQFTSDPTSNGLGGRVGMLVMPPGATVTGTLSGSPNKVGLVVNGDPSFNLSVFTPTVNAAILASTSGNGTAIVGQTQTGTAIYGQSDSNYGIAGRSTSGTAVYGASTSGTAVYGASTSSTGVYGTSQAANVAGVYGLSTSPGGYGVFGSSPYYGVFGAGGKIGVRAEGTDFGIRAQSLNGYAGFFLGTVQVEGAPLQVGNLAGVGAVPSTTRASFISSASTSGDLNLSQLPANHTIAVYGYTPTNNTNGYAGYFEGNAKVTGALFAPVISATTIYATQISTGVKYFKIDHPLDPANKYLYHTSVESPDMMNIYNGIVTLDEQGEATVEMAEWFEALNADFRYQLTSIGVSMPDLYIAEKLTNRRFKIAGGKNGQEVSWMVTGIRQDAFARAYPSPVEEDKALDDKGTYLHPELFDQPEEMPVHPRPVAAK